MPTTTDRDLLALEPNLFRDVSFIGQQVFKASVSLTAGVLTALTGSLAAAGVEPGHVLVADERPLEVLARTTDTTAAVSLVRASPDGAAIVPADFFARPGLITTFAPQIALVHAQLLRLLGIDAASGEPSILNPADLRLCESLGALHLIYSAASALTGPDSPAARRAEMYRSRFGHERRSVRIQIDTNGDGLADATRILGVVHLVR